MNHYMDFDPYVIRERNQQVQREVHSLRLEERLREERGSSGSRLVALAKRGVRPLLRAVYLAGYRWLLNVQGSSTPRRRR
jgi:hypothetical protein